MLQTLMSDSSIASYILSRIGGTFNRAHVDKLGSDAVPVAHVAQRSGYVQRSARAVSQAVTAGVGDTVRQPEGVWRRDRPPLGCASFCPFVN